MSWGRKIVLGQRYGRLIAVEKLSGGLGKWRFMCDCGQPKVSPGCDVLGGKVKSCGCLQTKHGMSLSNEYFSWKSAVQRCHNSAHPGFRNYGERGISVCTRWRDDFRNFLRDMGRRPSGTTLERIDVNGNYEPTNCRWATHKEQGQNRRNTIFLELRGVTKTLVEWCEELGFKTITVRKRIEVYGWSVEDALLTPVLGKGQKLK